MKYFYHPESDSFVKVTEDELEAFRRSGDGALCVEVTKEAYVVASGDLKPDEPYEKLAENA